MTISAGVVQRLNRLKLKQNELNDQIATGQKVSSASDNPQAAVRLMGLRSEKMAIQQYSQNVDKLTGLAQASFAALNRLKAISDRAGELATAASGVTSEAERLAYSTEVNELAKSAIEQMNTKFTRVQIFSGEKTDESGAKPETPVDFETPSDGDQFYGPYSQNFNRGLLARDNKEFSRWAVYSDSTGAVTGSPGTTYFRQIIEEVTQIDWSETFSEFYDGYVFRDPGTGVWTRRPETSGIPSLNEPASPVDSDEAPYVESIQGPGAEPAEIRVSDTLKLSAGTSAAENKLLADFVNRLVDLREALKSNDSQQISTVRAALLVGKPATDTEPRVISSEDAIVNAIARNGAIQTRLEALKEQNDARFSDVEQLVSSEVDADLAQSMVKLSQVQTAYQAAVQSGAQIMKLSLLDYI